MIEYNIQLKVATVQAEPVWLDADKTIDKAIGFIEEAAKNGAKLIAFPEVFIPGYHWHSWCGSPAYALKFARRYLLNSMSVGDARMQRLMAAARDNNIYVLTGYVERGGGNMGGGSLYMAQVFISDTGEIIGNRRKLKPTHTERSVYGEGNGSDLVVWETPIGRVGGLNCFEHFQPLEIYAMATMHEQIHVASWPSFCLYPHEGTYACSVVEPNDMVTRMYAMETQSFVLCATTLVTEECHKVFCDTPEKIDLLGHGGGFARIYHPSGVDLAPNHIPEDEEGILYADIDLNDILEAKAFIDPVGQYSRPDVLSININRNSNPFARVTGEPLPNQDIIDANARFKAMSKEKE